MKLRRIMAVVVTLGLLTHALALVMHNQMVLQAVLGNISLSDVLCQNSTRDTTAQSEAALLLADLDDLQKKQAMDKADKSCPLCLGLVTAHNVVTAEPLPLPVLIRAGTVDGFVSEPSFRSFRLGWPPSRGPPSFSA